MGNQKDVAMNAENPVQIDLFGVSATGTKDTRLDPRLDPDSRKQNYLAARIWPGDSLRRRQQVPG